MVSCPHPDWPQLFFVCFQCGDKAPAHYELMTRDEAHAWAEAEND